MLPRLWITAGLFSHIELTQWGRDKVAAISQTTLFKCSLLNENVWLSLRISLILVIKVQIKHIRALVQIMAWRWPGDKPLSEIMVASLLTYICVTPPHLDEQMFHPIRKHWSQEVANKTLHDGNNLAQRVACFLQTQWYSVAWRFHMNIFAFDFRVQCMPSICLISDMVKFGKKMFHSPHRLLVHFLIFVLEIFSV